MDDVTLKLGDLTLSFSGPPWPTAYSDGEAVPLVVEVSAQAGSWRGQIKGEGDVSDLMSLYRVLATLDRLVGQQANAEFSLDLDDGVGRLVVLRGRLAVVAGPTS